VQASLTIPNDWNSASNTIEVIGGGSHLSNGNGGGGGAYSEVSNLSFSRGASVSYFVGNTGSTGGDTLFNGSGTTCASQSVCAKGGGSTGTGGQASGGVGTITNSGGNGGGSLGGGGGAAGPLGNGWTGTEVPGQRELLEEPALVAVPAGVAATVLAVEAVLLVSPAVKAAQAPNGIARMVQVAVRVAPRPPELTVACMEVEVPGLPLAPKASSSSPTRRLSAMSPAPLWCSFGVDHFASAAGKLSLVHFLNPPTPALVML
jgi:hypothetical protein